MPDASVMTRLRLASTTVAGNRNSNRGSSLQGLMKKKLEIYGNAYTAVVGGGGADVVSYVYKTCNGCRDEYDPVPTGYPNLDGSFTFKQGGKMVIIPSSNVIKLTSSVNINNFSGFIYYNPLTSGATYTVSTPQIWVLPPGTFKSSWDL